MRLLKLFFIYIRLLSVKGCHSKGALITIQTQLRGRRGQVARTGFNETSNIPDIHKNACRDLRNPMLYIAIIASYGSAAAAPAAGVPSLCTCYGIYASPAPPTPVSVGMFYSIVKRGTWQHVSIFSEQRFMIIHTL